MRIAGVLCALALLLQGRPAPAQMADALGKPLADAQLAQGTVTVRVIDGTPTKPIVGTSVELTVGDAKRVARTDARGRARFVGLPQGARVQASIMVGDDSATSQPFEIPASGGVRLMLSPVPWRGGISPMAAAGKGAGRPPPRQMAGQPRPEPTLPTGTLRVRVLQGSWDHNAVGATVYVIGYRSDDTVHKLSAKTDAGGRATFSKLDTSGHVAYYATAILERKHGSDRTASLPIMMPARGGVALALAGELPDATTSPVDDLSRHYQQPQPPLPAGQVVVEVGTALPELGPIELVEIGRKGALAKASAARVPPQPDAITGAFEQVLPDDQLPPGSLMVEVTRKGKGKQPIAGAKVELHGTADDGSAIKIEQTEATGMVRWDGLATGARYRLVVSVHGKRFESDPFELIGGKGMRGALRASWRATNVLAARFAGVDAAKDAVLVAQTRFRGQVYRSAPLQLVPGRGTFARILVVPKLMFRFHLAGRLDDRYLVFQGQFALNNISYAPWVPPRGERLVLPLPAGFAGAQVAKEDEDNVKIVDGDGFLWKGFGGAVPPGGLDFRAAFTVPIKSGAALIDMPLPFGVFNSNLSFEYSDGMKFEVPGRATGSVRTLDNGKRFYVMRAITILPKQRMVMRVYGLPTHPSWRRHVTYAVGICVLLLLALGAAGVAMSRARTRSSEYLALSEQREALLADLLALEGKRERQEISAAKYDRAKKNLTRQLERVYAQLDGAAGTSG